MKSIDFQRNKYKPFIGWLKKTSPNIKGGKLNKRHGVCLESRY